MAREVQRRTFSPSPRPSPRGRGRFLVREVKQSNYSPRFRADVVRRDALYAASLRRRQLTPSVSLRQVCAGEKVSGRTEGRRVGSWIGYHDSRSDSIFVQHAPCFLAKAPRLLLERRAAVHGEVGPRAGRTDEVDHVMFGENPSELAVGDHLIQGQVAHLGVERRKGFPQTSGRVRPLDNQNRSAGGLTR